MREREKHWPFASRLGTEPATEARALTGDLSLCGMTPRELSPARWSGLSEPFLEKQLCMVSPGLVLLRELTHCVN